MKIKYDSETDSLYLILSNDKIVESEETPKDVIVDYNEHTIDLPIALKSA